MTTFHFVGGHLDQVPEYAENLVKAVGLATLNWARLEQQVDALLISVNKPDHSTEAYKSTPYISFRKKIEMFERWFARDPRFTNQRQRAERLTEAFTLAAQDRNLLTHSNVQEFIEGPPVKMIVLKTVINGDELRIERGEWTEEQIFGLAKDLNKLSYGLWTISQEVLRTDFLDNLRISE
jgi:hypothetical protein